MSIVTAGRVTALALSAGTFAFLFINDSWRADNLFLVPDLVLSAALLAAALVPERWAARALPVAFGFSAGVLITSVMSYVVEGRFGFASLLGAVVAVVFAALPFRSRPLVSVPGR